MKDVGVVRKDERLHFSTQRVATLVSVEGASVCRNSALAVLIQVEPTVTYPKNLHHNNI